jgi:hypothetical protein
MVVFASGQIVADLADLSVQRHLGLALIRRRRLSLQRRQVQVK